MRRRGGHAGERGNSLIEFALAFGLLFPVFIGCFQFGYSMYIYNELQTAIRCAARYASLRPYESATTTPTTAFRTAVQNMAVYANPSGGTSPIAPGLSPENVSLTVSFESGVPRRMTVAIANYRCDAVFRTFTFNTKPRMTIAYAGRWDAP